MIQEINMTRIFLMAMFLGLYSEAFAWEVEAPDKATPEKPAKELSASFTSIPTVIRLNLGMLKALSQHEFNVAIKNQSESAFKPEHVVTSCSCAAATVSKEVVAPNEVIDLRLKIAVPNTKGKFKRQVVIAEGTEHRLDLYLEGEVELAFVANSEEFVVSEVDRNFVLEVRSNEDIEKESFNVQPVTPSLEVESVDWEGTKCNIHFSVTGSFTQTLATVVVSATSVDGDPLIQHLPIRLREHQKVHLKPRVLRFKKKGDQWECNIFLYGNQKDLESTDLSGVHFVFGESSESLETHEKLSLEPVKIQSSELVDHGLAAVIAVRRDAAPNKRSFVRVSLEQGDWLDDVYITIFED
jgi:hypothetical protein